MEKGKFKQINLEVKDFRLIYKALVLAKGLELKAINKQLSKMDAGALKKYKNTCDKYDPLIERIKGKIS